MALQTVSQINNIVESEWHFDSLFRTPCAFVCAINWAHGRCPCGPGAAAVPCAGALFSVPHSATAALPSLRVHSGWIFFSQRG